MAEILELATSRNIELRLTRVTIDVKDVLRRSGNVYLAAADRIPDPPVET